MRESEDRHRKTFKWRSLCGKNEFSQVYENGYKRVGPLLVLYLLPAVDHAQGVVASRKVGGAVQRNRAKRLLREALLRCSLQEPEGFAAALASAKSALLTTRQRDRKDAESTDPRPEVSRAQLDGLWVVAIARPAILEARMQDVLAGIEEMLAP